MTDLEHISQILAAYIKDGTLPSEARYASILSRMLPTEKEVFVNGQAIDPMIPRVVALLVEITAQRNILQRNDQELEQSINVDDYAIILANLEAETEQICSSLRQLIGTIYSGEHAEMGQPLTSISNKTEQGLKEIQELFGRIQKKAGGNRDGAGSVPFNIQSQPIKHYFSEITQQARNTEQGGITNVYGTPLNTWQISVFRNDNSAEEHSITPELRAIVAGGTALGVKTNHEQQLLVEAYNSDLDIREIARRLTHENQTLYKKMIPRSKSLSEEATRAKNPNHLRLIQKSMQFAEMNIKRMADFSSEVSEGYDKAMEALKGSYSESTTFDRKAVEESPVSSSKKTARKARGQRSKVRRIAINVGVVTAAVVACMLFYSRFSEFMNVAPKEINRTPYQTIIPVTKVERWRNWIFATIPTQEWNDLSQEDRQTIGEKFFAKVKGQGYQHVEAKTTKGTPAFSTFELGSEIVLRVK